MCIFLELQHRRYRCYDPKTETIDVAGRETCFPYPDFSSHSYKNISFSDSLCYFLGIEVKGALIMVLYI